MTPQEAIDTRPYATPHDFVARFIHEYNFPDVRNKIITDLMYVVLRLYEIEVPDEVPPEPRKEAAVDHARWRDECNWIVDYWTQGGFKQFTAGIVAFVEAYIEHIPPIPHGEDGLMADYSVQFDRAPFIEKAFHIFANSVAFPFMKKTMIANAYNLDPRNPILPTDFRGDPTTYIVDTPLILLFDFVGPFELPKDRRFEHMELCAGTGHGKTQTLQYFIAQDINTDASVVVIDSQGDLIRNISRVKGIEDRIVLIDPTDLEYPPALNIFDVTLSGSRLEREQLTNSAIELMEYVLGAVLGSEMTARQGTLFRFCLRLLLTTEGATIYTLKDMMEGKLPPLDGLPPHARQFFQNDFNGRQFNDTKQQVVRRLWTILENQTLSNMLSAPKSKINIKRELDSGKIILINTAKDLLKQTGTEIMGRYFLSLIALAVQERASQTVRKPVFMYIDELADYARGGEQNLTIMLEQFRKYRCGLIMAHQALAQIGGLGPIIASNTSIKFAGGVSDSDARFFAREMRCDPDFIRDQPTLTWAAWVRGQSTVSVKVPPGYLEALPRLSEAEYWAMRERNRELYAMPYAELQPPETTTVSSDPSVSEGDW